ncbi:hypothetical protein C0J52_08784 [Blattella germanica]|nr:hypothetical protein C0J52_08784 [Blattella germanica]
MVSNNTLNPKQTLEDITQATTAPDQPVPNSTFTTIPPLMNNITTFDSTIMTLTFTANYSIAPNWKMNTSENSNNTLDTTQQFSSMNVKQFKFPPFLLHLLTMNPLTLITNLFQYIILIATAQRTFVHNRRKFVQNIITGIVRNSLIARVLNLVRSHILFRLQSGGVFRRLYHWWENRRFAPFRNTVKKVWGLRPMVKARELVGVLLDDMWNTTKLLAYLRKHVPPGRFWGGLVALRSLVPLPILAIGLHIAIRHVKLETIEIILEQLLDNGLFIIINQIVKGAKIGFTSD